MPLIRETDEHREALMEEYKKLLQSVLDSPHGKAIVCSDGKSAEVLRRNIYFMRKKMRDAGVTEYDGIQISVSPHSRNILYLVRKEHPDAEGS